MAGTATFEYINNWPGLYSNLDIYQQLTWLVLQPWHISTIDLPCITALAYIDNHDTFLLYDTIILHVLAYVLFFLSKHNLQVNTTGYTDNKPHKIEIKSTKLRTL